VIGPGSRAGILASRRRYDAVFYTPWVGSALSTRDSLPPGGAETQVVMLAQALTRRGLSVAIIAFGHPSELPDQVGGVDIVPRRPYKKGRLKKVTETLVIWRSLWRTQSPTIICRTANLELGLVAIFARLTRTRLVYSSANIADFTPEKMLTKRRDLVLFTLGARLADEIIVQTEEQIAMCEERFGRRPVMIKSLEPVAEEQDRPPEAFLWVGRLVSYKRPLEYIALARALPEARFWMIGVPEPHLDGDQLLAQAAVAEAQEVKNLELLPPRSHEGVESLMARAVASVNTADFEGMPNVLLEAWSRGVPALVLSHDPDGVIEKYGLGAYAEGCSEKLVELAREQWATRDDRRFISRRCRNYIRTHHAPERIAQQWGQVLSPARSAEADASPEQVKARCAA
jgi:glycosyltransferase involved in cell wall biosynthesis